MFHEDRNIIYVDLTGKCSLRSARGHQDQDSLCVRHQYYLAHAPQKEVSCRTTTNLQWNSYLPKDQNTETSISLPRQ